jgi:hypothetical protein
MTEQRWQTMRSERMVWTSFSVGLIGLLLLSLVLLVESLNPPERVSGKRISWVAEDGAPAPARAAPFDVATLEDMCRGVATD